ncbi:hypothetical protein AC230_09620 [Streptomyces caatingaensis]|uniref:Uncharacterized protein n=1 Tax=Streptomyces caatingaensis TaxID=1678637 RepID=A0A0K9XHL7_9ACTN|nr:hypothetical protein AC230_09620 [Streptomyces caatingaensis]
MLMLARNSSGVMCPMIEARGSSTWTGSLALEVATVTPSHKSRSTWERLACRRPARRTRAYSVSTMSACPSRSARAWISPAPPTTPLMTWSAMNEEFASLATSAATPQDWPLPSPVPPHSST